jgi:hypothetical protein
MSLENINWTLEKKKISELKDHPNNPRKLTDEQYHQIKESLEKFGIVEKPIINSDGTIIGGHQRLKILKKLNIKEIDCWMPDRILALDEVDELNIRLNRNHGEWDWDILGNNFETKDLFEWGFEIDQLTGIEEIEEKESKPKKKKACPNCGHEF